MKFGREVQRVFQPFIEPFFFEDPGVHLSSCVMKNLIERSRNYFYTQVSTQKQQRKTSIPLKSIYQSYKQQVSKKTLIKMRKARMLCLKFSFFIQMHINIYKKSNPGHAQHNYILTLLPPHLHLHHPHLVIINEVRPFLPYHHLTPENQSDPSHL